MTNKEQIELAHSAGYGGYTKTEHSKCSRPNWYGIQQVPALKRLLKGPAQTGTHNSKKKPQRVYARLTKGQYRLLQRAMRASGYKTVSEAVQVAVVQWIMKVLEQEKTAAETEISATVNTLKHNYDTTKAVNCQNEQSVQ